MREKRCASRLSLKINTVCSVTPPVGAPQGVLLQGCLALYMKAGGNHLETVSPVLCPHLVLTGSQYENAQLYILFLFLPSYQI